MFKLTANAAQYLDFY